MYCTSMLTIFKNITPNFLKMSYQIAPKDSSNSQNWGSYRNHLKLVHKDANFEPKRETLMSANNMQGPRVKK